VTLQAGGLSQRFGLVGSLPREARQVAAEVAAGLNAGFLGTDATLDSYHHIYWLPKLFERRSLAGWQEAGSPELRARARETARELIRTHEYELPENLARDLDRIYVRAERELAG